MEMSIYHLAQLNVVFVIGNCEQGNKLCSCIVALWFIRGFFSFWKAYAL